MKFSSFLFLMLFFSATLRSQSIAQNTTSTKNTNWTAKWEPSKAFIENKGQFDGRNRNPGSEILFAVDNGPAQIFFTKKGLTYRFDKKEKNADREEGDKSKPKIIFTSDLINMQWKNANPYVQIIAEGKTNGYHSYSYYENRQTKNVNYINAYKKITYKNLYPNIDVEYIFHNEEGIKYSLILHPGADISVVKMSYPDAKNVSLNKNGEIHIATMFGDIIDHAPFSFYSENSVSTVISSFKLLGNKVSFALGNYDNSKTLTIDPWTVTPTITNSNCVWECDKDAAGNVYIIGGDVPLQLQKYNSSGVWQWTYNTPWDTTNGDWLGALATDLAGNSYVSNGSLAEMHKVNTSGSMMWSTTAPLLGSDEYWAITFNCDQTKLIVGGTRGATFPSMDYKGTIYDINTNNGSVIGSIDVTKVMRSVTVMGFPTTFPNEVRAITSSRNARYYYLTHDSVGAINQNLSLCSSEIIFGINSTYEFGYKCEDWRPLITDSDGSKAGNGGICAIKANGNFVYTQNGATVHKRSLNTGAVITSATIPGGVSNASSGSTPIMNIPGNSGLDIDSCGNVYVGSSNAVVKYDANLNLITSVATPYKVYDVAVSYNGEVIVAGSTGTSNTSSRTGYVQSINMSACDPFTLVCCDASLCSAGPVCVSTAPFTLTPGTSGGTFSGPGITNSSTGMFNPATAGVGTHTIVYSQICGSDSVSITVNSCVALTACQENNGDITATSGNTPYTWKVWTPATATPITNQAECTACGYTWNTFVSQCFVVFPTPADSCVTPAGWTQFATGTTVTPPTFPILVVDNDGDSLQIPNLASLPNCSGCTAPTATTTSTATSCGLSNGTATVNASGGTSPYTYLWSNSQTTATISGLVSGTYSVTVTGGGCDKVTTVTVAASTAVSATATASNTTCGNNNGSVTANPAGGTTPYTYVWSNSQTTQTISGLAPGSYTVTVTAGAGCTITATATVNSSTGVTGTTTPSPASCGGNNGSALANPSGGVSPYTYFWSNSQTTQTATGLVAGNYTVTITDNTSCTTTATASVSNTGGPTVTTSTVGASCGGSNGTATVTPSGGTTPYTYSWSSNPVQYDSTATGLSAGTYDVTVTDASACVATASVTVTSSTGPTATTSVTDATCNGGSSGTATVTPSGGTTPYTYLWSNSQTLQTASGLAAGTYTVTFTDANNCTGNASVTIAEPTAITATTSSTTAACGQADGSATVSPSGGNSPYAYLWAANANNQTSITATGLAASSYDVTITDASGCTITVTASVSNANAPTATATSSDPACNGGSNGNANVSATGGATPYTYNWSTTPPQATTNATGLSAGTYSVTVSDFAGCNAISTVTLNNPAPISVQVTSSPNDTTCTGVPVTLTAFSSGASPSTYLWSTSATTSSITETPTSNTTYMVTTTDNNGCVADTSFTVVIASAAVSINKTCSGSSATLTATAGNSYLWSTNDTTQSIVINALADSVYSVTVNTICGPMSATDTVTGVDAVVSGDTTIGFGATIQIVASGGGYYLWSTGESGPDITVSPLQNTTYYITVTDADGCSDYDTINITVECRHEISVPTIFSPNHDGINDFIKIHGYGFTELSLVIYDRWGEKVFETTDKSIAWDGTRKGKELNAAVFVYILDVTYCDGVEYNEKGNITLIK